MAACADYGRVRRRIDALFKGRRRIADEAERQRAYATLSNDGAVVLASAGALSARTLDGHRARAAAFLAWDEGELIGRARRDGMVEDRLLAALLLDLVTDAG